MTKDSSDDVMKRRLYYLARARWAIKQLEGAQKVLQSSHSFDPAAELVERAVRAIEGSAPNDAERRWRLVDAVEKAAKGMNDKALKWTLDEASKVAGAQFSNRYPLERDQLDLEALKRAIEAAARKGKQRKHHALGLKWESFSKLIQSSGFGEVSASSLREGFARWRRTRKG